MKKERTELFYVGWIVVIGVIVAILSNYYHLGLS